MKIIVIFFAALLNVGVSSLWAQTSTEEFPDNPPDEPGDIIYWNPNFISTRTYIRDGSSSVTDIKYYNGLGYLSQSVSVGASNGGTKSIVTPIYYDNMQRESRQYLPYAVDDNTGAYRPEALSIMSDVSSQYAFYNNLYGSNSSGYSYTENVYEPSPLNRVTKAYNVGSVYRTTEGIKSVFAYEANTQQDNVMRFKARKASSLPNSLFHSGVYAANELFKNSVINEDGVKVSTFIDVNGRVMLERTVDDAGNSDTYYVYDDAGNLYYVIPPKLSEVAVSWGTGTIPDSDVNDLAYIYKYDGRSRCVEKHLPGAEPIYMVYDKGDRLVMTQDGNMRGSNKWMYTKYDNLDRVVFQSIITGASSRNAIQNSYNDATSVAPYDPLASDFSTIAVLSENSYGE
jgi:hypothetical protein